MLKALNTPLKPLPALIAAVAARCIPTSSVVHTSPCTGSTK